MTWAEEVQAVDAAAARYDVDPLFVLAIRAAEGHASRYQFGILDPSAVNYTTRLNECCATIRHLLTAHPDNPLCVAHSATGVKRVAYSDNFIIWFGGIYCPVGAENDPRGLNRNWVANVTSEYDRLLAIGPDDPSWSQRWTA
jgi:hypothetical protein